MSTKREELKLQKRRQRNRDKRDQSPGKINQKLTTFRKMVTDMERTMATLKTSRFKIVLRKVATGTRMSTTTQRIHASLTSKSSTSSR